MWRDATLVAGRDLRIEARSRVTLHQVAPFALLVLVLFAFALDPDRGVLERATPGLYWVTVLFSALLALARSAALDEADGVRDALRLSGLDPAGVFLGKAPGGRRPAAGPRGPARRRASSSSTAPTPPASACSLATCLAATVAVAADRYALRRPGQRPAGPRDAAPPAAAARAGAGAHRRHPGLRVGARRRPRRGLAVVRAARRLRCSLLGRRGAGLRHAPGGLVTATTPAARPAAHPPHRHPPPRRRHPPAGVRAGRTPGPRHRLAATRVLGAAGAGRGRRCWCCTAW